ncbi:MAG: hypothetical protein HY291_09290 [Planctomycetes bacterium]|nr:hypothetical protein [Planctomycetota bacterium]
MKAIVSHIEWLMAGVVILVCGVFIFMDLSESQNDALESLRNDGKKINEALATNPVDPKWEWSQANQSKNVEVFQAAAKRPGEALAATPDGWVFYPRPQRPFVAADQKPKLDGDIVKVKAALNAPASPSAKADHGSVYLSFKLPEGDGLKFFHVVRVEVFRGATAEEIKDLIGAVEIGTEEHAEGELPPEQPAAGAQAAEAAKSEDLNTTARSSKHANPPKEAAGGKEKPLAAEETPIPAEYKGLIVFRDQDVQPKKTYFYKVRLVGRLIKLGPGDLVAGPNKTVYKVEVPAELTPVKPAKADNPARLYAGALSDAASDTAPPNFQIRFAGSNGELPKEGQVLAPGFVPSYQGRFAVQVWVPALREWKEDFATVGVNQEITGTIKYKKPDAKDTEQLDYKTGLKLVEIVNKSERKMETRKVSVTEKKVNSDGVEEEVPVMDEKTGKPKVKEEQVEREIPNQAAMLYDTDTKKTEECFKRPDYEKRKEAFIVLDRIFKDQEAQAKKEKDRVAKLVAAQRAAQEKRKAEDAAKVQQPGAENPNMPPMMPPGGPPTGGPPPEGPGGPGGPGGGRPGYK